MKLNLKPRLIENLIYRTEDSMIFDVANGKILELNVIANEIILMFNGNKDIQFIAKELRNKYQQSSESEIIDSIESVFSILDSNNYIIY